MNERIAFTGWFASLVTAIVFTAHPRPTVAAEAADDEVPAATTPPTQAIDVAYPLPPEPPLAQTAEPAVAPPPKTKTTTTTTTPAPTGPAVPEEGQPRTTPESKAPAPAPAATPAPLTWHGVTLYGVVDVGVAYLSHGAPPSDTYGPSLPYIVQNFSNRPTTSIASNGLSQSKLGLSGVEPLGAFDLKAVFKLETGFQPTSGRLTDGPASLVHNNGLANTDKVTAGDSSRAGQPFQSAALAGLGSTWFGTLTFGRQASLMADDLVRYDPQLQSQAFSPIGYSGASGGLGDTEDKILDDCLKYVAAWGPVHVAGLYQFGHAGHLPEGAQSVDLGVELAGLSVDLLWGRVRGAVSAASLNAAQNAQAPGTLAATISDNTGLAAMARYTFWRLKLYAGYEHMTFANPKDPLPANTVTIGGYVLSNVNNTAYNIHKVLQYVWSGVRASATRWFELSAAYYYFRQNSYNANGCSDSSASSCAGRYHDASLVADFKLSPRFALYTGVNYSRAVDGMAAGYLDNHDWTAMSGVRFTF